MAEPDARSYPGHMPNCVSEPRMRSGLALGLVVVTMGCALSCAEPTVSRSADPTRSLGPVPACVLNLPPSTSKSGFARQIPEDQYYGLVVPSWKDGATRPEPETLACNGEAIFQSKLMAGATFDPKSADDGKITYGGGANGLKVVWLRTHSLQGGDAAGPLSLVRIVDNHAEVYGVTVFRGSPEKTRFDLERLGGEVAVTAVSDGCAGATGDCDTLLDVFRPVSGRLDRLTTIGLKRVRQTQGLEPGIKGSLTVSFLSSPDYQPDGIKVIEEVSFTDDTGRKLRRAQLERAYLLRSSGIEETSESLWDRLYQNRLKGAEAAPASPQETDVPEAE